MKTYSVNCPVLLPRPLPIGLLLLLLLLDPPTLCGAAISTGAKDPGTHTRFINGLAEYEARNRSDPLRRPPLKLRDELSGRVGTSPMRFGCDDCYQLEGPFNIGNPVHEKLTFDALKKAGQLPTDEVSFRAKNTASYWEIVRGTIWNDDPEGLLFGGRFGSGDQDSSKFSTGVEWLRKFKAAERSVRASKPLPNSLTARSHFGDLQFLHGMASKNDELAGETRAKILAWIHFTYQVATSRIEHDSEVASEKSSFYDLRVASGTTVASLFCVTGRERAPKLAYSTARITRDRALGSLLHLIQDSFSAAHVHRTSDLNSAGFRRIGQFLCYVDQDHSKHGDADIEPGAMEGEVLRACEIAIALVRSSTPWEDAQPTFEALFDPLELSKPSGPGNFGKEKLSP